MGNRNRGDHHDRKGRGQKQRFVDDVKNLTAAYARLETAPVKACHDSADRAAAPAGCFLAGPGVARGRLMGATRDATWYRRMRRESASRRAGRGW